MNSRKPYFTAYRSHRPVGRQQPQPAAELAYFERALDQLQQAPERLAIVKANLAHYERQSHLPKSAKAAIKRFQYLLSVTEDPLEMRRWILEDSYEGRKFRQLPLLLKGVCDTPL
ncbi:hypothetical protein CWE12_03235 [Aliidiomarina sedimenti]|uniref:DUF3135 domain-containing protein n=1 Tax=Aliidiomarina sedimenti TaxID=1933879 RepID=A0ABY0C2N1_9GAMM|nr:hypothetical protein [Aliidiomarina sedimenti]RUO32015.1 hypothetical protein CWE12_03235 [Aliidiomarina sedimenti]